MYRCFIAFVASLLLAGGVSAQSMRKFPPTALRGTFEVVQTPDVALNGKGHQVGDPLQEVCVFGAERARGAAEASQYTPCLLLAGNDHGEARADPKILLGLRDGEPEIAARVGNDCCR